MSGSLSADEIVKLAKSDNGDLKSMSQAEGLFYLQMINLFDGYRHRRFTADEAAKMKGDFVRAFEKYRMFEEIFEWHLQIRNTQSMLLVEAEKYGCPICKKLVRIFDGREANGS